MKDLEKNVKKYTICEGGDLNIGVLQSDELELYIFHFPFINPSAALMPLAQAPVIPLLVPAPSPTR